MIDPTLLRVGQLVKDRYDQTWQVVKTLDGLMLWRDESGYGAIWSGYDLFLVEDTKS